MSPRTRGHHALALMLIASGCLPEDDRPPPGVATVVIAADDALQRGFTTSDGWRVRFDDYILTVGDVTLTGDACNQYGEADYLRVLSLLEPDPQRLNVLHGVGACELTFAMRTPSWNSVLGAGVTEGTRAFMRQAEVAARIAGSATRDETSLSFAWGLHANLEYRGCGPVLLESSETQELTVFARGAALFGEVSGFDAFAAADRDGDAELTLDELARAPATLDPRFDTLGALLHLGTLPAVLHYPGARECTGRLGEDDD